MTGMGFWAPICVAFYKEMKCNERGWGSYSVIWACGLYHNLWLSMNNM